MMANLTAQAKNGAVGDFFARHWQVLTTFVFLIGWAFVSEYRISTLEREDDRHIAAITELTRIVVDHHRATSVHRDPERDTKDRQEIRDQLIKLDDKITQYIIEYQRARTRLNGK